MNDSNFESFVNSTHNLDDEPEYEIVFHNPALTNIFNNMDLKQITDMLEKPIFITEQLEFPVSIQAVANKRYSDAILSSVFRMKPDLVDFTNEKQRKKDVAEKDKNGKK